MNEICQNCKYRQRSDASGEQWNVQPHISLLHGAYDIPIPLLVLTNRPTEDDIRDGGYLRSDWGEWLREILSTLKVAYVTDSVLRCQSCCKPTPTEYASCPHYQRTISQYRPKAILTLGHDAAKVMTNSTMTMAQLKSGVWEIDGTKVVCIDHPCTHAAFTSYSNGGRDLSREYSGAFRLLKQVIDGTYHNEEIEYDVIDNPDLAGDAIKSIQESPDENEVAFDVETANVSPTIWHPDNELLCFGFTTLSPDRSYKNTVFDCRDWSFQSIASVLSRAVIGKRLVGTHLMYDFQCSYRFTNGLLDLRDYIVDFEDTMFLEYLPNQMKIGIGLEDQCLSHLGLPRWKHFTNEELNRLKNMPENKGVNINYGHLPRGFLHKYQAHDTWAQARVWFEYFKGNVEYGHIQGVYRLMRDAMWALLRIERNGIPIDLARVERLRDNCQRQIDKAQRWIDNHPFTRAAGLETCNANSTLQLSKVLRATGGTTRYVSKKTEMPSLDKEELTRQAGPADWDKKTPLQKWWSTIQIIRKQRDRISDFCEKYSKLSIDNRARAKYQMTKVESSGVIGDLAGGKRGGIDSGRIGASDLPTQTIEKVKDIRRCFVCNDNTGLSGFSLVEHDFSGAEMVVIAVASGCKKLLDIYRRKVADPNDPSGDAYMVNACGVWKKPMSFWNGFYDEPSPEQLKLRKMSKACNLGLNYMQSPQGLASTYGIPIEDALAFCEWYFREYHEVQRYIADTMKDFFVCHAIIGHSGRIAKFSPSKVYDYEYDEHKDVPFYRLSDILDMTETDGHMARKAVNFKIQSTTSDCTLAWLAWFDQWQRKHKDSYKYWWFTNFVHDSLWSVVRNDKIRAVHKFIKSHMENPVLYRQRGFDLRFPEDKVLLVEGSYGQDLGNMEGL